MKFIRMDWYPWDFDEDPLVEHLTWFEKAAYQHVLHGMWKWSDKHDTVDLPDDDWLASGAVKIPYDDWVALRQRLVDHPAAPLQRDVEAGVIYSPRLRKEYAKAVARSQSHADRGAKGGRPPKSSDEKLELSHSFSVENLQESNSLATDKLQPSSSLGSLIINQGSEIKNQENQGKGLIDAAGADTPRTPRRRRAHPRSPEAKQLALQFKQRLQARGVTVFPRDWDLKAQASAERLLKTLTADACVELMAWAETQRWWSDKTTTLHALESRAAEWQLSRTQTAGPGPPRRTQFDDNMAMLRSLHAQSPGGEFS